MVISIIGTLTAILLPNLMGARERARDGKKKQDMDAIKTGLRMFYNDTQNYPNTDAVGLQGTLATIVPNISNIDMDDFTYTQLSGGDGFQLCATMEAYGGDDVKTSQQSCKSGGLVCGMDPTSTDGQKQFVVCGW